MKAFPGYFLAIAGAVMLNIINIRATDAFGQFALTTSFDPWFGHRLEQ